MLNCGSSFAEKRKLEKHIEQVHEKKNRKTCLLCNHTFSNSGNLNAHIASVHEGKKPKKKYEEEKIGT